jgi:hypothetical protein
LWLAVALALSGWGIAGTIIVHAVTSWLDERREIRNRLQCEQHAANDPKNPPCNEGSRWADPNSSLIQPATEEYRHNTEERSFWERQIRVARGLNWITGVGAVVGVLGLIFIYAGLQESRRSNIDANRAWISPTGMSATGGIDGTDDIPIQIHYSNLGKSPALKMDAQFDAVTVPTPANLHSYDSLSGGPNNTCKRTALIEESYAIFPNGSQDNRRETIIPRVRVTPLVRSNQAAILIQGCFKYETMGEIHYSWFCFVAYSHGAN